VKKEIFALRLWPSSPSRSTNIRAECPFTYPFGRMASAQILLWATPFCRRCSSAMGATWNEKNRVKTSRRVANAGQFVASLTRYQRSREVAMFLGGLDPAPKIDPHCKWRHLLSDSTWRRTYSSVITDQQRRDRSQQGERSHRSRLGARTGTLGLSHQHSKPSLLNSPSWVSRSRFAFCVAGFVKQPAMVGGV
jgi:hypothetical protein